MIAFLNHWQQARCHLICFMCKLPTVLRLHKRTCRDESGIWSRLLNTSYWEHRPAPHLHELQVDWFCRSISRCFRRKTCEVV
jgi:hypothetical protein